MLDRNVGVIGASSFVGQQLVSTLSEASWHVIAFSRESGARRCRIAECCRGIDVEWRDFTSPHVLRALGDKEKLIPSWVCTAPIWVLPEYFEWLLSYGVQRIVVFSSTSRYSKENSSDVAEQMIARRLMSGEADLQRWAEAEGIEWVIVRPTMIYGLGVDKNIAEIMDLIQRWGFFPILGKGSGLRQPVHVEDIANACLNMVSGRGKMNRVYTLSGGEVLSYKEMVKRVFIALDKPPRFIYLPRWGFRFVLIGLRLFTRFQHWSVAMVDRMDRDLLFEHQDAAAELGFSPRPFLLKQQDLPTEKSKAGQSS